MPNSETCCDASSRGSSFCPAVHAYRRHPTHASQLELDFCTPLGHVGPHADQLCQQRGTCTPGADRAPPRQVVRLFGTPTWLEADIFATSQRIKASSENPENSSRVANCLGASERDREKFSLDPPHKNSDNSARKSMSLRRGTIAPADA